MLRMSARSSIARDSARVLAFGYHIRMAESRLCGGIRQPCLPSHDHNAGRIRITGHPADDLAGIADSRLIQTPARFVDQTALHFAGAPLRGAKTDGQDQSVFGVVAVNEYGG